MDQALYQSVTFFLPNSTFYRLMRCFHRTLSTGVVCWQGMLTPPDAWSHPIWDLHMFYLLRPMLFPNFYFFRTIHFEHPSVLSRFGLSHRLWNAHMVYMPSGTLWSTDNDTHQVVEIWRDYYLVITHTCYFMHKDTFS